MSKRRKRNIRNRPQTVATFDHKIDYTFLGYDRENKSPFSIVFKISDAMPRFVFDDQYVLLAMVRGDQTDRINNLIRSKDGLKKIGLRIEAMDGVPFTMLVDGLKGKSVIQRTDDFVESVSSHGYGTRIREAVVGSILLKEGEKHRIIDGEMSLF